MSGSVNIERSAVAPVEELSHHVVLYGNPNTGKTSLFNRLTGMRQRIGNYPGVTVERKEGVTVIDGVRTRITDLPGTYSLGASSPDEQVATDVLLGKLKGMPMPDLAICVVDASHLTKGLLIAMQVADLSMSQVIAVNFSDEAKKQGLEIDYEKLSEALGVPVIPTVAFTGEGIEALKIAVSKALDEKLKIRHMGWHEEILNAGRCLQQKIEDRHGVRLVEGECRRAVFDSDSEILRRLDWEREERLETVDQARSFVRKAGFNPLAAEAMLIYEHLNTVVGPCLVLPEKPRKDASEFIDKLLTHRVWGLGIFLAMMYVVFQAVYTWAGPVMDAIEAATGSAQETVGAWFEATPMLQSLMTDGVIAGVGAVVIFLPQILILYFFIAVLEDSGYMARAAFLMDRLFGWCGLNGKSFVPMVSSYACAIPGVMATRTIEDPKARLTTILIAPFMSCSARLPVYMLMIGAFIEPVYGPSWAAFSLFAMHFLGLFIAMPLAWGFNRFVLKTERQPFLLEMPKYRLPKFKDVLWRVMERGKKFLIHAGTIIFFITVIVWALAYFPRNKSVREEVTKAFTAEVVQSRGMDFPEVENQLKNEDSELSQELNRKVDGAYLEGSYIGRLGKWVQPAFAPAGFDWKITVGVLASFPAREVVIATLGVIYNLGGDVDEESGSLRAALRRAAWTDGPRMGQPVFTPLVAVGIMVFFALCMQCGATLSIVAKETSWNWALMIFFLMTGMAWMAAVLIYQVGSLWR